MARKGKSSRGRRKIEIKKIESEEARHVCFSKRRIGAFTKASELSTMCGADVAMVIYSPSGTPYSFGSPSVNHVIDRFLTGTQINASPVPNQNIINQLNQQCMELSKQIDIQKNKSVALKERAKELVKSKESKWLENIDQLSLDELNQLLASLYRAKHSINSRIDFLLGNVGPMIPNNMSAVPWAPPSSYRMIGPINYMGHPFRSGFMK
ncbi:hypothetical protein LUZ60_010403 [Juncus effusus]|nr:hypothetical protein LUZ60_010403 [Juncus effusus]